MSIFKLRFTFSLFILIQCAFFSKAFSSEKNFPFKRLHALEKQGIQVSALVVRLDNNEILAEISSDKYLIPASTTKLIIASEALETWAPHKTFTTNMLRRGEIKNGVLEGDLVFYGAGDPALINEKIVVFADSVAKSGIEKVTGKLIVNNSLFGNLKQDSARAGSKHYSQNAYDSPLSAAAVNYSVIGLVVLPGENIGSKAKVSLDSFSLPSVSIKNFVKTTGNGTRTNLFASRKTQNGKDTYVISGTIALNAKEHRVYRSVSNPDQYAGEVMAAYLRNAGIEIVGKNIEIESVPPKLSDKVVASIEGYPLSEQLDSLLKMSNNFIADMLLLKLSIEKNELPHKSATQSTLKNWSPTIQNYMRNLTRDNKVILKSGSGLTAENQLSAKNLIALLKQIYQNNNKFEIFLNSLTIPGQVGTLHDRFKTLSSQNSEILFRAKTGTLTEPCSVVSLAGYGQIPDRNWIGFAFIINGLQGKNAHAKHALNIDQIRQLLDADVTDFFQFKAKNL